MAGRNPWRSWAVVGNGHGGQALAAYLALRGEKVSLYNRTPDSLEAIRRRGGIKLEGTISGFGELEVVSTDLEEVLDGVRIIMVVVPASAHRELARAMAPNLQAGQTVILNPGRTLGAVEFAHNLRAWGAPPGVSVADTDTFVFASRRVAPGVSRVHRVKKRVRLAGFPAYRTASILRVLQTVFPQFTAAVNVLETGVSNIGAIFHPAPTLLNTGWVESALEFDHYHDGITPGVARALEALDHERLDIARAYGVRTISARVWLASVYGSTGDCLHKAIQGTKAYRGLKAAPSLEHRYLYEDVPASLVPLADLARNAGHPARVIESLIILAGAVTGVDWWAKGRTLASIGLGELGVAEMIDYVNVGLRRVPHTLPKSRANRRDTLAIEPAAVSVPEVP
jgi:opine dehydrogenase